MRDANPFMAGAEWRQTGRVKESQYLVCAEERCGTELQPLLGGSRGGPTWGHQAQCGGTNSLCLHTDGDEMPAQRSGCGHSGVRRHVWVRPYSLCIAQRGKAKGKLGINSSPSSVPQAFPWRKRQTMCLPVWPHAHRWLLPQRGTYLEVIHSEGMPF